MIGNNRIEFMCSKGQMFSIRDPCLKCPRKAFFLCILSGFAHSFRRVINPDYLKTIAG